MNYLQINVSFGLNRKELHNYVVELALDMGHSPGKQIVKMLEDIICFEERVQGVDNCVRRLKARVLEEPDKALLALSQFTKEVKLVKVEALRKRMNR